MSAIEPAGAAAHDDLIVLVENTGAAISLVDVPALGWITDEAGASPARPVIPWTLTPQWAQVEIGTKHVTPGLIGGAYISVAMGDQSFRGSFPGFLDYLVATTGLPINGSGLLTGALMSEFWSWAGRYGSGS
jgi:hypothetical protein